MGFKGSLASINLADIFQNLALNQQTGTIKITTPEENYYVYFERGLVSLFSRDKDRGGKLGEMVVGRGLAGLDQIEDALRKQKESKKRLGEILVEMGILTKEDVANLLKYQVEEAVYDLFHLDKGDFEFIDGEPLQEIFDEEQKAVQISVNTSSLIMEAARRVDEWDRMRAVVPSLEEIFIPQPALLEMARNGQLEPLDARILDFLDGGRDLNDVISESSFSRYEVVKTIAGFLEQGLIRSSTLDDLANAREMCVKEGRTRHIIKICERMLAKGVDNPDLRASLAEAAEQLGEVDKAAIHYGILARYYLDQGAEDHAVTILQKIVKLIPKHVPSRKVLARILSQKGEIPEAIGHYTALVQALVESRRMDEGMEFAKEGLDLDPENLDLLQALSHIHMTAKDKTPASAVIAKMGDVLEKTGRTRAAEEMYRRAVQIDPANAAARMTLNRIEEQEKARRAKPILVGVVVVVLIAVTGAGVTVGMNELLAKQAYNSTLKRYRSSEVSPEEMWLAIAKPSLSVDPAEAITEMRNSRQQSDEKEFVATLKTQNRKMELQRKLAGAEAMFKRHDYAGASPILTAMAAEKEFPDLVTKARNMLNEITTTEKYLKDYRKWIEANEGRSETLQDEYEKKLELLNKYPWCTEARELKLPVMVKTTPDGADIYVNGRFRGSSPIPLYYVPGERVEITASLKGYRSEKKSIPGKIDGVEMSLSLEREAVLAVNLGGEVDVPALFLENLMVVANRSGKILALDRNTGQTVWSVNVSEQGLGDVTSHMVYYAGRLYFGVADGTVRMVEVSKTGAKSGWTALQGARTTARPAVKRLELLNQRLFVFVADEAGVITCLEADTGATVWTARATGSVEGNLAATERYLYVPTRNGDLLVLESSTGREVKRIGLDGAVSDLILDNDKLYFTAGKVLYCRFADNPHAGPAWTFKSDKEITNEPSTVGERVYMTDGKKLCHCFDKNSGKVLWSPLETVEIVDVAAGGEKNRVYLADKEGTLYSMSGTTGRLRWKYPLRKPIKVPALYADARVYVITQDGNLYAFEDGGED